MTPLQRPNANPPTAPSPGLGPTHSTKALEAADLAMIPARSAALMLRRPAGPSASVGISLTSRRSPSLLMRATAPVTPISISRIVAVMSAPAKFGTTRLRINCRRPAQQRDSAKRRATVSTAISRPARSHRGWPEWNSSRRTAPLRIDWIASAKVMPDRRRAGRNRAVTARPRTVPVFLDSAGCRGRSSRRSSGHRP